MVIRRPVVGTGTPLGSFDSYEFAINRPHDPLEGCSEMHVLSELEEGYPMEFSGLPASYALVEITSGENGRYAVIGKDMNWRHV